MQQDRRQRLTEAVRLDYDSPLEKRGPSPRFSFLTEFYYALSYVSVLTISGITPNLSGVESDTNVLVYRTTID